MIRLSVEYRQDAKIMIQLWKSLVEVSRTPLFWMFDVCKIVLVLLDLPFLVLFCY